MSDPERFSHDVANINGIHVIVACDKLAHFSRNMNLTNPMLYQLETWSKNIDDTRKSCMI